MNAEVSNETKRSKHIEGATSSDARSCDHDIPSHRLQLVFTPKARQLLSQLKDASEAESYSELIRRALISLEHFYPEEDKQKAKDSNFQIERKGPTGCTERLQIMLPNKSMIRLKAMTASLGAKGTYSEVVRRALVVFAQLNYELGRLEFIPESGESVCDDDRCYIAADADYAAIVS